MHALVSSYVSADVRLTRALAYSSCTLLVWDYLLTLDDEIMHIWPNKWSIVKCFFIANRYTNLVMESVFVCQAAGVLPTHSNTVCIAFSFAIVIYQFCSYGSVHVMVLLRVWVLNGRTRKITITLVVLLTVYLCSFAAMMARTLMTFDFGRAPTAKSCGGVLAPFSWLLWIFECATEVCLFGLTVFTLRQHRAVSEFSGISCLVRSLYRHAVIFFFANTLSDICNTVAWTILSQTPRYHISCTLPVVLVNITGQRLAIDLRRLQIQKRISQSEVSREVEIQLAGFGDDP